MNLIIFSGGEDIKIKKKKKKKEMTTSVAKIMMILYFSVALKR